jgi:uncharacterized protein
MKQTALLSLTFAILCALPLGAQQPQENVEAKQQDIRRLMEMTGAAKLGLQLGGQLLDTFKQQNPNVPETFWDDLLKELDAESLVNLLVPIYDKHLTHEDIKGLIAFNESPLGRKVNGVMPTILQESMQAGQQWGMEVAQKVLQKLEARQKDPHGK